MPVSPQDWRSLFPSRHKNLLTAIRQVNEASDSQLRWLHQAHRSLICESRIEPQWHAEFERVQTGFDAWHGALDKTLLAPWDYLLRQIAAQHREMLRTVRPLFEAKTDLDHRIAAEEYDRFVRAAYRYKASLRALEFKLIREACMADHLTGVWNRGSLYERLSEERDRMIRHGGPCSLSMMDLDHFKDVNDRHGHTVGDHVLQEVVEVAKKRLRRYDSIFRYGGEEFLFCLPKVPAREACAAMERIRDDIASRQVALPDGALVAITASFGVAELDPQRPIEECIERADRALLDAKNGGRNQVRLGKPSPDASAAPISASA